MEKAASKLDVTERKPTAHIHNHWTSKFQLASWYLLTHPIQDVESKEVTGCYN